MENVETLLRCYLEGDMSAAYPLFDELLEHGCTSFRSVDDLRGYFGFEEFVFGYGPELFEDVSVSLDYGLSNAEGSGVGDVIEYGNGYLISLIGIRGTGIYLSNSDKSGSGFGCSKAYSGANGMSLFDGEGRCVWGQRGSGWSGETKPDG